jgi:hypothetical protein
MPIPPIQEFAIHYSTKRCKHTSLPLAYLQLHYRHNEPQNLQTPTQVKKPQQNPIIFSSQSHKKWIT